MLQACLAKHIRTGRYSSKHDLTPSACLGLQELNRCGVTNTVVGVCGFGVRDCPEQTIAEFCRTNPSAKNYSGGLSGSPDGEFAVYVNAMYWAPSSCKPDSPVGGGFCSYYTQRGKQVALRPRDNARIMPMSICSPAPAMQPQALSLGGGFQIATFLPQANLLVCAVAACAGQ